MIDKIRFDTIQQVNDFYGVPTLHPMVSVLHLERTDSEALSKYQLHYGVYAIWLKETKGCNLSYGRTPYDFDEQTVTSFEPGQTVTVEITNRNIRPRCIGLLFHPDFLNRTQLGRNMQRYEFFSYSSTEALHLSRTEVCIFKQVLDMIEMELQHPIDNHTRELIVSNIELLLNYCLRFYDRQFITREEINHNVVKQFDALLKNYIQKLAEKEGLPTVSYFADKCCLTPGYFGQLVKTETGRTAKDFINDRLLISAKEFLNDDQLTVNQISARLGFEYPQHFVRFFKQHTGQTPNEYRKAV
ncbi:MAG: helix-turn-helix domain-containing protein [Odoribacter sp.]|nr:helix-turn-helix domain-containing protein [Odoribacter sp.]